MTWAGVLALVTTDNYAVHLLCYCSLGDKLHEGRELAIWFTPKIATVMVSNSIILLVFKNYVKGNMVFYICQLVHLLIMLFRSSLFLLIFGVLLSATERDVLNSFTMNVDLLSLL